MKEKLQNLLTVKSIVTLVLTAVFAYLAVTGVISEQEFMTIFTVVISFYFGAQYGKRVAGNTAPVDICDTATCPLKEQSGTTEVGA